MNRIESDEDHVRYMDICIRAWERDCTMVDVFLLCALCDGELRMSDLGRLRMVSPPSITKAVERLEDRGLASRINSSRDRRAVYSKISPRGRDTLWAILGGKAL